MPKFVIIMIITLLGCSRGSTVYLCNGHYSHVYHKTRYCHGLRKCSTAIEAVDMATAKARKRRKCGFCY